MKLGGEDGSWGEGCDGEAEANGVLSVEGQLQGVALRPSGVCDVAGGPGGAHHVRRFHAPPFWHFREHLPATNTPPLSPASSSTIRQLVEHALTNR